VVLELAFERLDQKGCGAGDAVRKRVEQRLVQVRGEALAAVDLVTGAGQRGEVGEARDGDAQPFEG
jgi:hypothetical protein